MNLEEMNLVGTDADTMLDHIFACHDALCRLRSENKMLTDTLAGKETVCVRRTEATMTESQIPADVEVSDE